MSNASNDGLSQGPSSVSAHQEPPKSAPTAGNQNSERARPIAENATCGAGTRDIKHDSFYDTAASRQNGGNFDRSSLEREYNSRQMGAARAQSYHTSRPAFRGGGGGRRR